MIEREKAAPTFSNFKIFNMDPRALLNPINAPVIWANTINTYRILFTVFSLLGNYCRVHEHNIVIIGCTPIANDCNLCSFVRAMCLVINYSWCKSMYRSLLRISILVGLVTLICIYEYYVRVIDEGRAQRLKDADSFNLSHL